MTQETRKKYNEWYWDVMVQKALQRIMLVCRSMDRNLTLTTDKEDFFLLLKYLNTWEKNNPIMNEEMKRDLFIIRNFEGYQERIAA
ncbi:MAG: hypothetical protein WCI00_06960 [bacterium]